VDLASLGIAYIALAISNQWGILSHCVRRLHVKWIPTTG
jgi:hypothetical protein